MPRIVIAARCSCAGIVAAVSFCSLDPSIAHAQQSVAEQLPPVEVTKSDDQNRTRARAIGDGETGRRRARSNRAPTGTGSSGSGSEAVASDGGIVGAATTVITAADIAHAPSQTLAEIIATQVPGAQITTFYGGQIGARTSVDLRGFGAFATANTLVLVTAILPKL